MPKSLVPMIATLPLPDFTRPALPARVWFYVIAKGGDDLESLSSLLSVSLMAENPAAAASTVERMIEETFPVSQVLEVVRAHDMNAVFDAHARHGINGTHFPF